jgi:hypothetical protein
MSSGPEGGVFVGWTQADEWLEYTVNVTQAGTYTVQARVAADINGGTFHIEFNGVDKTGPISIPYTGGWETWKTVAVTNVQLSAGQQRMRLVIDAIGEGNAAGNIDYIDFSTSTPAPSTRLRWAPPTLNNPETVELAPGKDYYELEDRDYIIKFPNYVRDIKTHLVGGRNIHIIGGHAAIPRFREPAITLQGQTGTVHIEGLLIDNPRNVEADAIAIGAPDAIVQIQNVRVVGLLGGEDTNHDHADVIQPWGGIRELRIDRLTGSSNYQGLFLKQEPNTKLGPIIIRNTNLLALPGLSSAGGHMLWLSVWGSENTVNSVSLSEVYITPRPDRTLGNSIWPDDNPNDPDNGFPAQVNENGDQASWPSIPNVTGIVKRGPPPNGDFVPAGVVGLNYVSPGYE